MGRFNRRIRRAAARRLPEPSLQEIAPGVYDLALPVPPGVPDSAVREVFERFRRALRADLGIELSDPRWCEGEDCPHNDQGGGRAP